MTDLEFTQGETFTHTFTWTDASGNPLSLVGYSAELRVFVNLEAENQLTALTFKPIGGSANTSMTLGGAAGTIAVRADAAALAPLKFDNAYYTLLVQATDGTVTQVDAGTVTLLPGVAF